MEPFIGLWRPFSLQAERLPQEGPMRKSGVASVADEPMGIVIATGNRSRVQTVPQVRAYFWFSNDELEASLAEERAAD